MMTSLEDTLDNFKPLIRQIARSAVTSSNVLDVQDLIQVGTIAAIAAIKSYDSSYGTSLRTHLGKAVRNAIFGEAARFIGPMTVADHVITSLAADAARLAASGMSDSEIASSLSRDRLRWQCTPEYAMSLRLLYQRRHASCLSDDIESNDFATEDAIMSLLAQLEMTPLERSIIYDRWLGDLTQEEIMRLHGISRRQFFSTQKTLKRRLYEFISETL
jgi:RNA polymerase sigma factor (sigma-70 family)